MKRKGPTEHYASRTVVAVSSNPIMWDETKQNLKNLRTCTILDELVRSIEPFDLTSENDALLSKAHEIKSMLSESIAKESSACQLELADIYRLQMELQSLHANHDDLEQEIQDLAAESSETKDSIYEAQQVCRQEMEQIDLVEAERMQHVPKLKEQISLFATTTPSKSKGKSYSMFKFSILTLVEFSILGYPQFLEMISSRDQNKKAELPRLKCFHNGIILIVICFHRANVSKK